MTWFIALALLGAVAGVHQASIGCTNCMSLGKEGKAMFLAHSDSCMSQSHVDPKLVNSLLNGELIENPALKSHLYCVLLKCKVISKDGKLRKNAVGVKMFNRPDGKNSTKILENCADQTGDTPEDIAWNMFRCGFDNKTVIFNYMPADNRGDLETNTN